MKTVTRLLLVSLFSFLFASCSKSQSTNLLPVLSVFNWTCYMPQDVIKDFEKKYSVKVRYDLYDENEEMLIKVKRALPGDYDVVFPSGDHVSKMIRLGLLANIDKTQIPNIVNIDKAIIGKMTYDKEMSYCIPYMAGASAVIVNTSVLPKYDEGWRIFALPNIKDKFSLLDSPRDVIGAALKSLGFSVNTTNPLQLQQAKATLLLWKNNGAKFDSDEFGKNFAEGKLVAVNGYVENVFDQLPQDKISSTKFFFPKEGGAMYVDNMVVLKSSKNKELAYKFINYILEPSVSARICDFLQLPSINIAARSLTKKTPHYTLDDISNYECMEDMGDNSNLYDSVWVAAGGTISQ